MRDNPFPRPKNGVPDFVWASRVWSEWGRDGFPVLVGIPAEQWHVARSILYPSPAPAPVPDAVSKQ